MPSGGLGCLPLRHTQWARGWLPTAVFPSNTLFVLLCSPGVVVAGCVCVCVVHACSPALWGPRTCLHPKCVPPCMHGPHSFTFQSLLVLQTARQGCTVCCSDCVRVYRQQYVLVLWVAGAGVRVLCAAHSSSNTRGAWWQFAWSRQGSPCVMLDAALGCSGRWLHACTAHTVPGFTALQPQRAATLPLLECSVPGGEPGCVIDSSLLRLPARLALGYECPTHTCTAGMLELHDGHID